MTIKEAATILGLSKDEVLRAIEDGIELPRSRKKIRLTVDSVSDQYDIDDNSLDEFIRAFEDEVPGRHPPVSVRRELLVEAMHRCAICKQLTPIAFHHIIEFSKLKHHDPAHMLAVCPNDHARIHNGEIDKQSLYAYKSHLRAWIPNAENLPAGAPPDKVQPPLTIVANVTIVVDSPPAQSLLRAALDAIRRGENDEALIFWTSLISLLPEKPVPYYNRGNTYYNLGRNEEAIADYDVAINLYPKFSYAYNNRGIAHGNLGHSGKALSDFNRAIERDPKLAQAYHNRGITFQRAGDYASAVREYGTAIELQPNYIDAYVNRGRIHGWQKQYEEALTDFDKVIKHFEERLADSEKAIKLSSKAVEVYWHRGTMYIYLGHYEEAVDDFNKALELKPGYAEAYCNRGVAYEKRGQFDQALVDYGTAIKFKPDYVYSYRNRGIVLTGLGRFDEALADFGTAIKLKPGYADTYNSRGIVYILRESYQEALDEFNKAIERDPKFAQAYNNIGSVYAKLHELPKAILAFNAAIEHNPKFAGAYESRGRAHYNLGNYEKALEDFSKVIDLTPGSQEAFYNRSNTLLRLQRYNEAQQDLERAVDLDPNDTSALLILAETAIFTRSIERVLSIAEHVLSLSDEPRDRMLSSYFKCLALHLGRQDTREAAAQLEEELQENVNLNWSFEEVRTWLGSADLDEHTKDYILSITDRLESTGSKEARQDTFRIYVLDEDAEPKQLPSAPEEDT